MSQDLRGQSQLTRQGGQYGDSSIQLNGKNIFSTYYVPKQEIKQWMKQKRSLLSWSSCRRREVTKSKQINKQEHTKISAPKIRWSERTEKVREGTHI